MANRFVPKRVAKNKSLLRIHNKALSRCKDVVQDIVDEIKTGPVIHDDTGRLRESFETKLDGDSWVVTSNIRYWRFVEFGTKEHGDAQHPIRTAIEVTRAVRRAR